MKAELNANNVGYSEEKLVNEEVINYYKDDIERDLFAGTQGVYCH